MLCQVAYSLEFLQLQQLIELEDRLEMERKEMSDINKKMMIRQDGVKEEICLIYFAVVLHSYVSSHCSRIA